MLRLISPLAMRLGGGRDQLELVDRGILDPVDFAQARVRRVNDFGKRAEFLQQRFGQRLGVAAGQGGKQRHLEQFVIAQRVRPGAVKALAQPLAMAVIMRRLGGLRSGGIAGLGWHRRNHAVPASFCNSEVRAGDFGREKAPREARRLRSFQVNDYQAFTAANA